MRVEALAETPAGNVMVTGSSRHDLDFTLDAPTSRWPPSLSAARSTAPGRADVVAAVVGGTLDRPRPPWRDRHGLTLATAARRGDRRCAGAPTGTAAAQGRLDARLVSFDAEALERKGPTLKLDLRSDALGSGAPRAPQTIPISRAPYWAPRRHAGLRHQAAGGSLADLRARTRGTTSPTGAVWWRCSPTRGDQLFYPPPPRRPGEERAFD